MNEEARDGDLAHEAAVERAERVARFGLGVSAGVAVLVVGFVALAVLLGSAVMLGGVHLLARQ
ncbi:MULTISPECIES: hypothetical protein [unclassified Kitasatospora]|uniref:hypothetical protein n=1 Tax=unclassified Kitasatospora TaxID=2633591 RepID=UPI00381456CD